MNAALTTITPGSVIKRIYYAVPGTYTIGPEYPTFAAAGREALVQRDRTIKAVRDAYGPAWPNLDTVVDDTVRPQSVVDLRWVIASADGKSVTDTAVDRLNVYDLTVEHFDRVDAIEAARPSARR